MKNKDYFIEKTSKDLTLDLTLVDLVITSSYKDLLRTLSHSNCYEAEISGLGTLQFNKSRSEKKLDTLYKAKLKYENKLINHTNKINILSPEEFSKVNTSIKRVIKDITQIQLKYNNKVNSNKN